MEAKYTRGKISGTGAHLMIRDRRALAVKIVLTLACVVTPLIAQTPPSLTYPKPHTGGVVDDFFGTTVADPYRWMEDLNAPDVKQWVEAENAGAPKRRRNTS